MHPTVREICSKNYRLIASGTLRRGRCPSPKMWSTHLLCLAVIAVPVLLCEEHRIRKNYRYSWSTPGKTQDHVILHPLFLYSPKTCLAYYNSARYFGLGGASPSPRASLPPDDSTLGRSMPAAAPSEVLDL